MQYSVKDLKGYAIGATDGDIGTEGILVARGVTLEFVNPALERILGYPLDKITSEPFINFIYPDDQAMVVDRHLRRMRGESVETGYDFRIIASDGTVKWLTITSQVIGWEGAPANLSFIGGHHRSQTGGMRWMRAKTASAGQLPGLAQGCGTGTWSTTGCTFPRSGRPCWATRTTKWRMPFQAGRISGIRKMPRRLKRLSMTISRGETSVYEVEHRLRHKDGSWHWILTRGDIHMDAAGRPVRWVGTNIDITDRKQAEEARFDALARFSGFADASQYGMGMADLDGRITFANATLARMLGEKTAEDCLGKHFPTAYYSPSMTQKLQEEVLPTLMSVGYWHGELELQTVDGRSVPTEENYFVIRDEQGRIRNWADILTDITERKRAEEERRS